MTLDISADTVLSRRQNDSGASLSWASLSSGRRWYCAWTQPQDEWRALSELTIQGFETYLPLCVSRRNFDRAAVVPLFPRYLFAAFSADTDNWGAIQHTRGVSGLIRHAPGSPTPLPLGVVEHLQSRTSERGVVDDPGDAPARIPHGAAVSVTDGPMAGLAGIVTMSSAARCSVLCQLLGREVAVSVDPRHLTAA